MKSHGLWRETFLLKILTQIEEMLIARVSPILQVTYAKGDQLKYSGHTISFPQDIPTIASQLPRRTSELDIIIVNRESIEKQQYDFYISKDRVYEALKHKIQNDPYYWGAHLYIAALALLPITSTDV